MSEPEPQTQCDLPLSQYMDCGEEPEVIKIEDKEKIPDPWARLISRSPTVPPVGLSAIPVDESGRLNSHFLGRSANCALRFETSIRISNKHCNIFCKENRANPSNIFLEAWIEDLSANGTFVNKIRLKKNVPRLLHNGDEVFLINPEATKLPDGSVITADEIARNSFNFMLYLPSANNGSSKSVQSRTMSKAINEVISRTSTVVRLLGQERDIKEHYQIGELLGSGTSGNVYLGVHNETGKKWAIKVMDVRKLTVNNTTTVEDLTKEAEMLRSLRHPGIIHLEDIFSDDRNLYLVMELSGGGDLFDRILKKRFYPEPEAKVVIVRIMEAIKYLHDNKVAHRDLKPENILMMSVTNDLDVKLTDFGLAKKVDETQGGMKTFCGTPQYFAPEVLLRKNTIKGQGRYSVEADMWSVGVILFVLLCGNFPFQEKALASQIKKAQFSFLAEPFKYVSDEAKDLVSRLLVVNTRDRLTADQALAHPWITGIPAAVAANNDHATSSSSNGVIISQSESPQPGSNKRKNGATSSAAAKQSPKKKQQIAAVGSGNIKEFFAKHIPLVHDLTAMAAMGNAVQVDMTEEQAAHTGGTGQSFPGSPTAKMSLTGSGDSSGHMEVVDMTAASRSTTEELQKAVGQVNLGASSTTEAVSAPEPTARRRVTRSASGARKK